MIKIVLLLFAISIIRVRNQKGYCYTEEGPITECTSMTEDIIAFATAEDKQGWHLFNVHTNPKFSNEQQAYGAGFLEGYIYADYINYHFTNVRDTFLGKSTVFSAKLNKFVMTQKDFYTELANRKSNDYEEALYLILQQHEGMWYGYLKGYEAHGDKAFPQLDRREFDILANLGELVDLIPAYPKLNQAPLFKGKDCTGFVRIIGDKLYVAHNTHNLYSMMNRIFKYYDFTNMKLASGKTINGYKFNSRPGDLNSKDDYYQLTNQMIVVETSLNVFSANKYDKLSPYTVPKWIRTSIANKLANDNEEWIKIFLFHNSGTHNNQWLIVNIKRFLEGKKTKIVNMVEQTPNIKAAFTEDMSHELFRDGYFASYNAAYSKRAKEDTGSPDSRDYFHVPRYWILRDMNKKVESLDDIKRIMRYHDSSNFCDTIGARCDLVEENKRPYGAIDVKLTSSEMIQGMKNNILYGIPYFEGISTPFNFDDWPDFAHHGIEKVSDFEWIDA